MKRIIPLLLVLVLLAAGEAAKSTTGTVAGEVAVDGGARAGVVVHLEGVKKKDKKPLANRVIYQRNKQFSPSLTVIPKGTTVDFPNQDKIFHNVFSVSRPARFDLGLYKAGSSKSVEFKRVGVVDVYCNIHPEMVAKVRIVEDEHFAITDASGKFRIDNVPPGTYPVVAWMANAEEVRGQVTVKAGGTADVKLSLKAGGNKAEPHLRKDGTPYGRYK